MEQKKKKTIAVHYNYHNSVSVELWDFDSNEVMSRPIDNIIINVEIKYDGIYHIELRGDMLKFDWYLGFITEKEKDKYEEKFLKPSKRYYLIGENGYRPKYMKTKLKRTQPIIVNLINSHFEDNRKHKCQ